MYGEFIEQLHQSEEGWYESELLWKPGHAPLPTNERGGSKRLESLVRRLQREPGMIDKYNQVIQEQLAQGIVESNRQAKGESILYPSQTCDEGVSWNDKTENCI